MNTEELNNELDRLQGELIDAKVDNNIANERIRILEKDLAAARTQIREYEIDNQTINKLRILGESDDDNGNDPRASGRSPHATGEHLTRTWKGGTL